MQLRATLVLASIALAPLTSTGAAEPFSSTYSPQWGAPTLIQGATVLTGTGARIDAGDVLIVKGEIQAVGRDLATPPDALVIDARGRWVTPGLIDVHSHLGIGASPQLRASPDYNESTSPVTAHVWAEHSIWPQDPGFETALAGGVTTSHILPGSANLIGGRSVVVKNVPATTYQEMKFPGAPHGLKMACGENPKSVYGRKGQSPTTRMASVAGYRQAFADAQDYRRQWQKYQHELEKFERKKRTKDTAAPSPTRARGGNQNTRSQTPAEEEEPPSPPKRDLGLETLAQVLEGSIAAHVHCYRADDMQTMLDVAAEFGFRIAAFHHAVEAYKVADRLAEREVCAALWADYWGFKMEAFDGIQENLALVDRAPNGCAIVHSDSEEAIQRLNQEAAKAMMRANRIGLSIAPERAIRWLTANPAKALGIAGRTGTLAPGMMADLVIWNRNPFSVYALADQVFVDGVLLLDRQNPAATPRSDFQLGQDAEE